jgi:hypothetical protein
MTLEFVSALSVIPAKRRVKQTEIELDRRGASFETAASQLPQDEEFPECHHQLTSR